MAEWLILSMKRSLTPTEKDISFPTQDQSQFSLYLYVPRHSYSCLYMCTPKKMFSSIASLQIKLFVESHAWNGLRYDSIIPGTASTLSTFSCRWRQAPSSQAVGPKNGIIEEHMSHPKKPSKYEMRKHQHPLYNAIIYLHLPPIWLLLRLFVLALD